MADFRRVNLRLNLDNPVQRNAWNILAATPRGYRTEAVCRALLRQQEQENLRKLIQEVVHEELKHSTIRPCAEEPEDDAVLGFLRALQEGDDDF
ncbi:MAG: hypothetical protein PUC06_05755 [Oscillospiraceae bacterium]|nr:hypothetical protein [Oscillospiraceae bacterium]